VSFSTLTKISMRSHFKKRLGEEGVIMKISKNHD